MAYRIHEVLNYGGFFAGDTVTVIARAVAQPSEETVEKTFTIDQSAFTNIGGDRYKIVAGLALDLQFEGERVSAATVRAAQARALLRSTVVVVAAQLPAPRIFAHHCASCDLWILGEPSDGKCGLVGHGLLIGQPQ